MNRDTALLSARARWWRLLGALLAVVITVPVALVASAPAARADVWSMRDLVVQQPVSGWLDLEAVARQRVADLHGVADDARLRQWGRGAIRSQLFMELMSIVSTPAAERTAAEQEAYEGFQRLVRDRRLAVAEAARSEYQRWFANPCGFVPPPGTQFSRSTWCATPLPFTLPQPPSYAHLTTYGAAVAYADLLGDPVARGASDEMVQTMVTLSALTVGLIGAGVVGAAVGASAAATVALMQAIVPYAVYGGVAGSVPTSSGLIAGTLAASSVAVVVVAIAIAVTYGIMVVEAAELPGRLDDAVERARELPDLQALAADGQGAAELAGAFLWSTTPDIPGGTVSGDEVPAAPISGDERFAIRPVGGSAWVEQPTFSALDWSGSPQTVTIADRWFVIERPGQAPVYSLTLEYQDPDGVRRSATIFGNTLVHSRPDAAMVDGACAAVDCFESTLMTLRTSEGDAVEVRRLSNRSPELEIEAGGEGVSMVGDTVHVAEGAPVTLTATASDPDDDPVTVTWTVPGPPECRDCVPDFERTSQQVTSTTYEHRFPDDGTYEIVAVATDSDGGATRRELTVVVANEPATLTEPDLSIDVVGRASYITGTWTDPGANDSHELSIDWGDGSAPFVTTHTGRFESIFPPTYDIEPGTSGYRSGHTYRAPGTYTVTVTVTDDQDATTTLTRSVMVDAVDAPAGAEPASAPTVVAVTPGRHALTLELDPGDDGGAEILGYEYADSMSIVINPDGSSGPWWKAVADWNGDDEILIEGISPAAPLDLMVRAVTAVGPGAATPWVSAQSLPNTPPTAVITGPAPIVDGVMTVEQGTDLVLSSAASTDDLGIAGSMWVVLGGPYAGEPLGFKAMYSEAITIPSALAHDMRVGLRVTDVDGETDDLELLLRVTDVAPRLAELPDLQVSVGERIDAAVELDDFGDDVWTTTVDWGTGDPPISGRSASRSVPVTQVYNTAGTYTATVTATDTAGGTDSTTFQVVVVEPDPIAVDPDEPPTGEPTPDPTDPPDDPSTDDPARDVPDPTSPVDVADEPGGMASPDDGAGLPETGAAVTGAVTAGALLLLGLAALIWRRRFTRRGSATGGGT